MLSYREADIFETLKSQNIPIYITCDIFSTVPVGQSRTMFFVRFSDEIQTDEKEIISKLKSILYPILEEYGYSKKGLYIMNSGFVSMDGATNNYLAIMDELRQNSRVKSLSNKITSMSSSFNKTMEMTVFIRG